MDKMKGFAKGGWHPSTDKAITRENWKSDLKSNIGLGKKKDPYEDARNHQSTPLTSLKDPDSFGPPPKHRAFYGADGQSRSPSTISRTGSGFSTPSSASRGGLGAPVVESGYAERKRQEAAAREAQEQAELDAKRAEPYRTDTSGLRTDHLPKPPIRRNVDAGDVPSAGTGIGRTASPVLPPRAPPRQMTGTIAAPARTSSPSEPPPFLPPRQNEYPDEYAPPPPPTYNEALSAPSPQQNVASMAQGVASRFNQNRSSSPSLPTAQSHGNPAVLNQSAMNRLGQAGVSVQGFGIGSRNASSSTPSAQHMQSAATMAHGAASRFGQSGSGGGQLSELQQRFARMNPGSSDSSAQSQTSEATAAAAQKKPPPPPPPKKTALLSARSAPQPGDSIPTAPPIPTSSKPRPF